MLYEVITLSIMVGGKKDDFDALLPLFELMGKNIVYQGKPGSGQHTKMCNQIAIASGMMGVCESLAYAQKAGLDQKTVLKSIESRVWSAVSSARSTALSRPFTQCFLGVV